MNEIVKRVADAIFDSRPNKEFPLTVTNEMAIAAIMAIREPSKKMEEVACDFDAECDPGVFSYMIDAVIKGDECR